MIDVLTTPIPILSDLGSDKVTLLDFAGLDPSTVSAIQGLSDILDLIDLLAGFSGNDDALIDLGSLTVDGDIRSDLAGRLAVDVLTNATPSDQSADLSSFLNALEGLGGGGLSFPLLTEPSWMPAAVAT